MLCVWQPFFLTLIDGVCTTIIKQPCRNTHHGHIPGWQCQDSSGSNCERMVGRESRPYIDWMSLGCAGV